MPWADQTPLKLKNGEHTYRIRAAKRNQVYLGRGGFGMTYLADCLMGQHKGKRVVIKTIHPDHYNQPYFPQLKNDFFTEALNLKGFSNRYIVQIWDLFHEPLSITTAAGGFLGNLLGRTSTTTLELPCMVQEYIAGESLFDRLWRKKAPLPEAEALKYIQQAASALAVLHHQDNVHRDVKPENIMLRKPEYEAVLIDFGLVRSTAIQTHTASLTPGYAPPEQYLEQYDRSATLDIYALAATLYTLLTGLSQDGSPRLVDSRNRGYELYMRRSDPLSRPEVLNPRISPKVAEAIWQGMTLDPAKRPPTIAAWLNLLGLSLDENDRSPALANPTPPIASVKLPPFPTPAIENPLPTKQTVPAYPPQKPAAEPKQPLILTLKPKKGGKTVRLELLPIPGGSFWMGRPDREEGDNDELPRHRVTVPPFWMGRFPVTQGQYEAVMGENPATRYEQKFVSPNQPVIGVSWDMAVQFCEALNGRFENYQFRLPTEAEWEYACRAGTETAFYFGDKITPDQANFDGNYTYNGSPKGKYREVTTPVGQFPANAWGLQDMHGNVWEWCADEWYNSYAQKPEKLKQDGSIPWTKNSSSISPSIDGARILRGGSWLNIPRYTRSADRYGDGHETADNIRGFRVSLSARTR
jgi:formylglycine-generating enzyme required for sulfatase activity